MTLGLAGAGGSPPPTLASLDTLVLATAYGALAQAGVVLLAAAQAPIPCGNLTKNGPGAVAYTHVADGGDGVAAVQVNEHGFYLVLATLEVTSLGTGHVDVTIDLNPLNGFMDYNIATTPVPEANKTITACYRGIYSTDHGLSPDALTVTVNNGTTDTLTIASTSRFRIIRLGSEWA